MVFDESCFRTWHGVLEDVNRSMKLIRHDSREYSLDVEEIAKREHPPMNELSEYLEHRQTVMKK
jgi:hypothetical protein